MRLVLRSLLVSYISIYASQKIVGGFEFGGNSMQTTALVVLAVALLNMFLIPIFKVLSLPHEGVTFLFLGSVLTLITLYVLTMFVGRFNIVETELSRLRIFGFVLTSRKLTVFWSAIYSSLVVSIAYHFIEWLFGKR